MKKIRSGGFLITKIHQLGGRIFNKLLKKYEIEELNSAQGRILFALWERDNVSITELSDNTRLEKSTLTSMLDRLENDGFVVRVPSKEDRRKIIIKRTDKDRKFQANFILISEEMNGIFYKGFSSSEIDVFEYQLKKILNNLAETNVDE
jgi:MarR family transcriptional regulator, organic hydroperoxide resistance regulator